MTKACAILTLLMILIGFDQNARAYSENFDINTYAPQGYHPGSIAYWTAPYFANAFSIDQRNWRDKVSGDKIPQSSGQLSPNGYPLYLDPGQIIQTHGTSMEGGWHQVAEWPDRDEFYEGQVVLTWKGDADVRVVNGNATYISAKSNIASTGMTNDGYRVYLMATDSTPSIEIHSINTNDPITEIKCWLPDPIDPQNSSLENQIFHPYFLDLLDDRDWGWIRFMDFGFVNQNPQQDWIDRRPGGYAFQEGILNERSPAEGIVWYTDSGGNPVYVTGDRMTGTSYETMVALCNETDKDMWLNIPHLATDDFITKLAQLIRYGSDGFDPYTTPQASPEFPPLNSNLTVFVEFSNEIWASNGNFPQGIWAQDQANTLGISKAQFNARQFSRTWDLFEGQLGTGRVHRVAAVWTAESNYTADYINEFYTNPSLLHPEMMAVTTYFGNGIQNWANDQNFVPTNSTPWTSTYWTSQDLEDDLAQIFSQWNRYILSGLSYSGDTGPDNVGSPGGFSSYLRDIGLARNLPIVAYEGGPSIYTDKLDGSATEDDGITLLMNEANRRQTFADLYYIHINQAFERGLSANVGFVDVSQWGKYGQWGHFEYLGQPKMEAVKYQMLLQTFDEFSVIRSIDDLQGTRPQFDTDADLPRAETDAPYNQTITISGGDGALSVELIGIHLPAGLAFDTNTLTIAGTPQEAGSAYVYLRVLDADNDPAWRTFTFPVVSRSTDPATTIDFEGLTGIPSEGLPVQPLILGDYSFSCPQSTNGLAIRDETVGWPAGWPSKVLHGRSWGNALSIERVDQQPFDLLSVEIGSFQSYSCKITASQLGGGTTDVIVNLPLQKDPLIFVDLDFVSVTRVDFTYYTDPNASNGVRNGALDNLKLNQITAGSYDAWSRTVEWNGASSDSTADADNDQLTNLEEFAMDLDPLSASGLLPTISTDNLGPNVLINYRRSRTATGITWYLHVTDNLLNTWSNWPVDNVRVYSDVIDPDVDGDGSAELMRYRVMPEEDQQLFFRLGIE